MFFICLLFPLMFGFVPQIRQAISISAVFLSSLLFFIHCSNFLSEAKGRAIMDREFSDLRSRVGGEFPVVLEGYQEHNSGIHYTYRNKVPFLTTGWLSRSPFQRKALNRFGLNSFGDMKEYALLTPTTNLEIVFPAYMEFTFGDFYLKDSIQTDNFIFLHFEKQ